MKASIKLKADVSNLNEVFTFVRDFLQKIGSGKIFQAQIELCTEEIFVNIANYAYPDTQGDAELELSFFDGVLSLTFRDFGLSYNPLLKKDPDTTLSAEERQIGGLGIFLVKSIVDSVEYFRKDEQNILILKAKVK